MPDLIPFQFETHEIRVQLDDAGEPWWVATDIGTPLGYPNIANVVKRLDEDEKGIRSVYTPGGPQDVWCVNEAGLYELILGSRKKEAKAFKRWVKTEVLPSIRKTGKYEVVGLQEVAPVPLSLVEQIKMMLAVAERQETLAQEQKRLSAQHETTEARLNALEAHLPDPDKAMSVKAYACALNLRLTHAQAVQLGKRCVALSKTYGYDIGTIPDDTYGFVNKYDRRILQEVFTVAFGEPPDVVIGQGEA